jgi:hypothetical protein
MRPHLEAFLNAENKRDAEETPKDGSVVKTTYPAPADLSISYVLCVEKTASNA